MKKLSTKSKFPIIGSWLNTGSTTVAEIMSGSGLDFVTIDMEHSAVSLESLIDLLRAIRSGNPNCKAFVRTPGKFSQDLKRYMDAGADGVIVPAVNETEETKKIVSAIKYPPEGLRGVGFARDNSFGMRLMDRLKDANDQSFICVQIENLKGLGCIDEILSVPGVDAAFLGPYDLSASMGIAGNFDHPDFINAISRFKQACEKNSVIAGIHVIQPNPQEVLQRIEDGYQMIAYSLDITLLNVSLNEALTVIRKGYL